MCHWVLTISCQKLLQVVTIEISCVRIPCNLIVCSLQGSLSFTVSWSLFKLMCIELVMPSSHLILCHPLLLLLFWASASFPMSQLSILGGQSTGVSNSASVLPVNIQGLFPWGLTSLISLLSKGLSRVFSSTTIRKHQFFSTRPSWWSSSHIHTWLLEKP